MVIDSFIVCKMVIPLLKRYPFMMGIYYINSFHLDHGTSKRKVRSPADDKGVKKLCFSTSTRLEQTSTKIDHTDQSPLIIFYGKMVPVGDRIFFGIN